jgi:hypothetical protein
MKKYISADVHQMLQAVTTNQSPIKLGHNTLGYQGLQMFGVTYRLNYEIPRFPAAR